MEWIGEVMVELVFGFLSVIFTVLAGRLGVAAKRWMTEKSRSETTKELAKSCVQAVEQMYQSAKGEEKMAEAICLLSGFLRERGIEISPEEIRIRLESALCEMKKGYQGENG